MTTSLPPPPPPPVQPTFAIGQTIGHLKQYTIIRQLGRGGFGEVFLADEKRAHRRVAIKTMLPKHNNDQKLLNRFKAEYTFGSLLSHPSLVQMIGLDQSEEGVHFIVMEYIDGETLSARMKREEKEKKQLGLDAALHVAWQMSSILAQFHSKKAIHRDLKPHNIMVIADPTTHGNWRYKLIDFGIAKLLDADEAASLQIESHTTTGMFFGTTIYASPENIQAAKNQGPASDVYSLGCILYRCIAGRDPFTGKTPEEVAVQHVHKEALSLTAIDPGVPLDIADLIHSMMEKDPAKRPTMEQVAEFFARKLGLVPAAAGQIVVKGGTQELQAVLADLATGAVAKTDDGSRKLEVIEDKSVQGGQLLAAPKSQLTRQRQLNRVAVGLAVAVVLALGAVALRSVSSPPSRPAVVAPIQPAPLAVTVTPLANVVDLGVADASPVSKPADAPQAGTAETTPAPGKKHRKKKGSLLVNE